MLLAVAVAATAALAPAAQAAVPDTWVRWAGAPRDTTIRSLDFLGPLLYGASESDGVYSSPTSVGPWTTSNDGLEGIPGAKSVRQVKVAPTGALYAATSAGLFSAMPGGGAWTPVGQGVGPRKLSMGGIQAIMFNDPSGMDMTVAVAGAAGPGVYNSSDGGANWDRAAIPTGQNVYHLTATVAGTPMYASADDGVFVSVDFGRSWTLVSDGIPPGETTLRVAIAPDDPTHLYASTSSGVYVSKNAGLTWEERGGSEGQILPAGGKRAFVLAPSAGGQFGPQRAIVGTESGAWATIDDGEHWGKMSPDTAAPDGGTPMGDRIVWSLGLGFSPPSLLAGTAGFGVFAIALQPIEAGTVTISPSSGLKPGSVLTANLSAFAGTRPYFFSYQWKRCNSVGCTPTTSIAGATSSTYTVPTNDAALSNVRYAVTVIARNLVRPGPVTVTSAATAAGVAALPGTTPRPAFGLLPSLSPSSGAVPTPELGQEFTINHGTWRTEASATILNPQPAFRYRWERCNGATCADIPGATGQKYTAAPDDIARTIRAYVAGTTPSGSSDWWLAGVTNLVVNTKPVNTTAPKVVGDAYLGTTLSSSAGGWTGHAITYERRWLRCEADGLGCNPTLPVQTGSTYKLTEADRGKRLVVEVTAIGADESQPRKTVAVSQPSAVVTDPPPPPAAEPGAAGGDAGGGGGGAAPGGGTPSGGSTPDAKPTARLTVPRRLRLGAVLAAPRSFPGFKITYRWLRNGKAIKKATKRSYRLTRKDRGRRIACRITLTPVAGGTAITVTTKAVKVPKRLRR